VILFYNYVSVVLVRYHCHCIPIEFIKALRVCVEVMCDMMFSCNVHVKYANVCSYY